jgi:hypothetical protein
MQRRTDLGKEGSDETSGQNLGIEFAGRAVDDGAMNLVINVESVVGKVFLYVFLEVAPVDVARVGKQVEEERPPKELLLPHNSHQVALYLRIHVRNLVWKEDD